MYVRTATFVSTGTSSEKKTPFISDEVGWASRLEGAWRSDGNARMSLEIGGDWRSHGYITHMFNPRPVRAFLITRTVRGGWYDPPPWRSAPDGRRASRKKPVDAPRRDLAIAHIVFGPRSIFDLVRSGQRSNFREKWHFLALHAHSGVSMCRSDLKPSPACSSFNSEQDRMFLLYPVAIFSIRSAPK